MNSRKVNFRYRNSKGRQPARLHRCQYSPPLIYHQKEKKRSWTRKRYEIHALVTLSPWNWVPLRNQSNNIQHTLQFCGSMNFLSRDQNCHPQDSKQSLKHNNSIVNHILPAYMILALSFFAFGLVTTPILPSHKSQIRWTDSYGCLTFYPAMLPFRMSITSNDEGP